VVLLLIVGVAKLIVPVPPVSTVPPLVPAYQSTVSPSPGLETEMVADPELQTVPEVAPVGAAGLVLIAAVTAVREVETQLVVVFLASA
jgi:hypothetical protein